MRRPKTAKRCGLQRLKDNGTLIKMKLLRNLNEGLNIDRTLEKAKKVAMKEIDWFFDQLKDDNEEDKELTLTSLTNPGFAGEIIFDALDEIDPEGEGGNDPDFQKKFKAAEQELTNIINQRLKK